jgi:hypothetical protein
MLLELLPGVGIGDNVWCTHMVIDKIGEILSYLFLVVSEYAIENLT